jgi:hypothetical protein
MEMNVQKLLIPAILTSVIVLAVGFALAPTQKASTVHTFLLAKALPETQWFSLNGITLADGEFLDLVDTTPALVRDGHVALFVPCDTEGGTPPTSGTSTIDLLQGRVGVAINTLAPVDLEFIPSLSDAGDVNTDFDNNCLYHVDIGTPAGVTDFAIINTSGGPITFTDRHTIAFTIAERV